MGASTKDLLNISEQILTSTSPVKEVVVSDPIIDDGLKAVVVPDSFVDQIVGFAGKLSESCEGSHTVKSSSKKVVKKNKSAELKEDVVLKERLETLLVNLRDLIKEAKQLINEVTFTGNLGTAPIKKKKLVKYGSSKSNKRN